MRPAPSAVAWCHRQVRPEHRQVGRARNAVVVDDPAQLPDFLGREDSPAAPANNAPRADGRAVVLAITGIGAMGKTATV